MGFDIKYDDEMAEKEVLSGLFNIPDGMAKALEQSLSYKHFAFPDNKILFKYCVEFYKKYNTIPDKRTIVENISVNNLERKIDFETYVDRLMANKRVELQRMLIKIEELYDLYLIREWIKLNQEKINDLNKDKTQGRIVVRDVVHHLSILLERLSTTEKMTFLEAIEAALDGVAMRRSGDVQLFYKTGFKDLDDAGGVVSGLTYVLGRPGACKSLLLLIIAYNMAVKYNIPVLIISAEMSNEDNVERLLSFHTKIPAKKILHGDLTDDEMKKLEQAKEDLKNAPVFFAFNPDFNLNELIATIMWYKDAENVQVFFLDYFQLFRGYDGKKYGDNQQVEYADISEAMRKLSKKENLPIVCAAQATRKVEERKDKRIQLQDVRSTDKAALDAGDVWALYNDEMYYKDKSDKKGILEIGKLKSRKGEVGKRIDLRYVPETQTLMDVEYEDRYEEEEMEEAGLVVPEEDVDTFEDDFEDDDRDDVFE